MKAIDEIIYEALKAVNALEAKGINARLINMHTIKPLDKDIIIKAAKETKMLFTVEEHSIIGGLGSAVCECLAENHPAKVVRIGMRDRFGESGPAAELIHKYGLDAEGIVKTVKENI